MTNKCVLLYWRHKHIHKTKDKLVSLSEMCKNTSDYLNGVMINVNFISVFGHSNSKI